MIINKLSVLQSVEHCAVTRSCTGYPRCDAVPAVLDMRACARLVTGFAVCRSHCSFHGKAVGYGYSDQNYSTFNVRLPLQLLICLVVDL